MIFSHDTEVALLSAVNLINTAPSTVSADGTPTGPDSMETVAQLDEFVVREEFTGSREHSAAEVAAVRDMRAEMRSIFSADEDTAAATVNELLARAQALPQLVKHDQWDWHLHATAPAAPLAQRMGVEAAMALVDVIRAKELGRLKVCAAPDCCAMVIDLSKNRSRRYCDTGNCGNRAHVAAYRRRQSGLGSAGHP
ncbi:CGNR zinc finger domain-containing protein [Arthrobacter sp. H35-D1]|uniref:CGNR zinc finger domain-containing protein n=1 Tax=Arthrobacter sp. H35-D1 TaxID=3046202 RepID=UPI0024BACDBC|nr:CGNR zinc finger domain-containing protein [Arthrobacter sp. H35-D1]MDJ0312008.1 CGNR zinc finger domain-containing protein [Arthrobacter sp. H35-D1]